MVSISAAINTELVEKLSPDATEAVLKLVNTNRMFRGGGGTVPLTAIKIDDEIIGYEAASTLQNGDQQTLAELHRGMDGTQAAVHNKGAEIKYFVKPEDALRLIFSHECGHAVGMKHRAGNVPHIMLTPLGAGEVLGNLLADAYDQESLGEFSVVPFRR